MLAGTPPFSGETSLAIALKHVKDSPVSLAVHRPELPPELVDLVAKLMQKKPADRYQTAGEMLRDLGKIREKLAIAATTHTGSLPSTVTGAAPTLIEKRRVSTSSAWRFLSGVFKMTPQKRTFLMLAALSIGGLVGWMNRQEDLLSPEAPVEAAPPGLWIVPEWAVQTPKMANAEQQYRYAQIAASNESREAAWLAVPGYFRTKTDHAWWIKAYCQLARELFARRDAASLEILGKEISRLDHPDDQLLVVLLSSTKWVFDNSPSDVARELAPFASSSLQPNSINSSFIPLLLDIVRGALDIRVDDDTNIHNSLRSLENRYSAQFPWERLNRRAVGAAVRKALAR
jgi:serine/threonine-protein kinase